jgi:hypothetical protein
MRISVKSESNPLGYVIDSVTDIEVSEDPYLNMPNSYLTTARGHGRNWVTSYTSTDRGYEVKQFYIGRNAEVEYESEYESGKVKLSTGADFRVFVNKVNMIIALENA